MGPSLYPGCKTKSTKHINEKLGQALNFIIFSVQRSNYFEHIPFVLTLSFPGERPLVIGQEISRSLANDCYS